MLNELFTWLNTLLTGNFWFALTGSFLWGVLSILLSPCHLSTIPLVIAYITRKEVKTVKRSFQLSLLFSIGILFSIVMIGLITALLGRIMGDVGDLVNYIIPAILILAGFILLDFIKIPFIKKTYIPPDKTTGTFTALSLGVVVGIGLGPCTFAFIAPLLALLFSTASSGLFFPILLLASFSLGHCLIISLAGVLTKKVQKMINLSEKGKILWIIKKVFAGLLILFGIYLMYYY